MTWPPFTRAELEALAKELDKGEYNPRSNFPRAVATALYYLTELTDLEGDMALARIERDEARSEAGKL